MSRARARAALAPPSSFTPAELDWLQAAPAGSSPRSKRRVTKPHVDPTSDVAKTGKRASHAQVSATVLKPGAEIDGRWRIVRELGRGGMGSVWEAEHTGNGFRAAIKFMHPDAAADENLRNLFFQEAAVDNIVDTAAHVPHPTGPGAVKVYDSGTTSSGAPYMVMEQLKGQNLHKVLHGYLAQGRAVPPTAVAHVLGETLHVLEGAHAAGVVHRDIKPENIMLTEPTHDVKLLDFGLARLKGGIDYPRGSFVGTKGFAPPEQILGYDSIGPATDVWALGATAYAMLTGRYPMDPDKVDAETVQFVEAMPEATRAGIVQGTQRPDYGKWPSCPALPVRLLNPNVPEHLAQIVDKMLLCRPQDRPTVPALRRDLQRAVQEMMARRPQLLGEEI